MAIPTEHNAQHYHAPTFAPPPSPLELAARVLLGHVRVTLGMDPFLPTVESGERLSDIARRFEDLRFELIERRFSDNPLGPEEEGILAAINEALLESMPVPTPEPPHVQAAVEEAKLLLARRRGG